MPRCLCALTCLTLLVAGCGGSTTSDDANQATTETSSTAATTAESEPDAGSADSIVVRKSGIAVGEQLVNYGAVLENTSDEDARLVIVKGSFVDAAGTILDGVGPMLQVIPAGATYYWAGSWPVKGGTPVKLEIVTEPSDFQDSDAELPTVSEVKISSDGYNTIVRGRVTNTLDFPLSQIATVNAVFFDDGKNVIGGGSGFLPSDLAPGREALFEINAFNNTLPKDIASVEVTVDATPVP